MVTWWKYVGSRLADDIITVFIWTLSSSSTHFMISKWIKFRFISSSHLILSFFVKDFYLFGLKRPHNEHKSFFVVVRQKQKIHGRLEHPWWWFFVDQILFFRRVKKWISLFLSSRNEFHSLQKLPRPWSLEIESVPHSLFLEISSN